MTDEAAPVRSRARPSAPSTPAPAAEKTGAAPTLSRASRGALAGRPTDNLGWMKSGDAGAAEAQRLRAEQEARDAAVADIPIVPYRYKLDYKANNGAGEVGDTIILDAQPGPRFWEHKARNPRTGYWTEEVICVREWDECCLCPPEGESNPYFIMLLTVLDLRQFTNEETGITSVARRKLLGVKLDQQGIFDQLYAEHGTLRGVHLVHTRSGGQKSSTIGNDIAFDCIHTEEELEAFAKGNGLWEELRSQKGRLIHAEGGIIQPIDYAATIQRPTGAEIRLKYGAGAGQEPLGSAASNERAYGSHNPGRAAPPTLARGGSNRRVQLDDGAGLDDEVPF